MGGKKTKNKMLDTIDCLTVDLGMSRYLLENVGGGGGGGGGQRGGGLG